MRRFSFNKVLRKVVSIFEMLPRGSGVLVGVRVSVGVGVLVGKCVAVGEGVNAGEAACVGASVELGTTVGVLIDSNA